ncbi:uncharacterized protein LOC122374379 [Amphibalanus amphitrite]|uniref:uncharacterized protein LOC122374379 n=1 Tax=Amphibalanus amphitrite TaxID=1232801 RepID=UPI001C913B2E|nr:uncharacterized protein LOC122374379 [Amphibalanus amphitrite]
MPQQAARQAAARDRETTPERQQRIEQQAVRRAAARDRETTPERQQRLAEDAARHAADRQREDRAAFLAADAERHRLQREELRRRAPHKLALIYSREAYVAPPRLQLGQMEVVCAHCGALRWRQESPGACCHSGKVAPPFHPPPPEVLCQLFSPESPHHRHFTQHLRAFNSAFQLASMGCQQVRQPGWNPVFTVHGTVCHRIGSLLPAEGAQPEYLQIYFYDRELEARMDLYENLHPEVLQQLQEMLHDNNIYVRGLHSALELVRREDQPLRIVLSAQRRPATEHERRFNLPETGEVAVLMPEEPHGVRDIVLHHRDGGVERINEYHRSYDPLHYVLLHPHGTDGWSLEMKHAMNITATEYYAFHLRYRPGHFNLIARGQSLFQQLLVDAFAKIESDRLCYLRQHQPALRTETLRGLTDAIHAGDEHGADVGRIVLPASFTGSARYMVAKLNDAMAYVREFGGGDLFITVTCNPMWAEIKDTLRRLYPGQQPSDHPEVVSQVFRQKLRGLLHLLREGAVFGQVRAFISCIEWQKRGLPHAHIVLWLEPDDKPRPDTVDLFVSAGIPDPITEPELHAVVTSKMVHGPCGAHRPAAPCMADGACTKRYPKQFAAVTEVNDTGYPQYRRRSPLDGGRTVQLAGRPGGPITVDNRWIVPYNPLLSRALQCHVNVELITHAFTCIRYVLKYVTKGSDQVMFAVAPGEPAVVDEIATFQQGRYLSAMEAAWRLLQYPIHEHLPTVEALPVHLGGQDRLVRFHADDHLRQVIDRQEQSKLTSFFNICAEDEFAATLLYHEVPRYYTWQTATKSWRRRRRGAPHPNVPGIFSARALGRVYAVSPRAGERFFLRLLLHNVRGPRSFEALRTVNGQEACSVLGLLEDGQYWHRAMAEAAEITFPRQLRCLFALITIEGRASCDIQLLWRNFRTAMSQDVRRRLQRLGRLEQDADLDDYDPMDVGGDDAQHPVFSETLRLIGRQLRRISGLALSDVGLPHPPDAPAQAPEEEDNQPIDHHQRLVDEHVPLLTQDQRDVYDEVTRRLATGEGGLLFLQAPGGSGKTFLENVLLASVRAAAGEAIAVATSGIAASLLDGGTTAHSRFKIPISLTDTSTCDLSRR